MALNNRARQQMLAHCGEIHDDDGVDPREFFKVDRRRKKDDRKVKQLCRQTAETLAQVLAGETNDDVLRELRVAQVVAAPNASRLLVTLQAECDPARFDIESIQERLACRAGQLRAAVAAAITRRKTPTLVYHVNGPVRPDNGQEGFDG